MRSIVWLDGAETDTARTGGKGASLIELQRSGFPVPPGFVIASDAYTRFVAANDLTPLVEALLATPDLRLPKAAREAVAPLLARVAAALLPDAVIEEIRVAYAALRARGVEVVAARSSALSEDAAGASSAGLYETFLNLRDLEAVLDAVRRCYTSLWTARAVQYRAFKGMDSHAEAMAVVVMALVPAEIAGVAFTANPVSGDRGQIVVNASWGLGEAVVSGRVTPDNFVILKEGLLVVERDISPKEIEIVPDPAGLSGTVQRPVSAERAAALTLSEDALRTLGALCCAIERHYGRPMDIEWAYAGGTLYVLQARPITGLA